MDELQSATEASAQDINSRLMAALDGEAENSTDAELADGDDGQRLPDPTDDGAEDDDSDIKDDEESGDSDDDDSDDGEDSDDDASLAAYLGVDEERVSLDDEGVVQVKAIVDGEELDVPLPELVKSYQLSGHVNNKSIALAEKTKEFDASQAQITQALETKVNEVVKMAEVAEQALLGEYGQINWDKLRAEDPTGFSIAQNEFQARAGSIQRLKQDIAAASDKNASDFALATSKKQESYLNEQLKEVVANNPGWEVESARIEGVNSLMSGLKETYGVADEDLAVLTSAKAIRIVQDALAYSNGKKTVAKKKSVKIPKFQSAKQSVTKSKAGAKAKQAKANKKAVRDSGGSIGSVANSILDRM